ncbi:MAG: hypothetical protein M3O70_09795 [Actinomycetota bacterium]|nr:hypothetical protein [Actinomycetota bacterium]
MTRTASTGRTRRCDEGAFVGLENVREIIFPRHAYERLLQHGRRKLRAEYLPGEETERKAYGLLGGRLSRPRIEVTRVFPLRRNLRYTQRYKGFVDEIMERYAVPSDTPFERRGWIADPREVMEAERACQAHGGLLFGTYHMHRVPWGDDPFRDTCTELDARLAEDSGLWMLILSMVDPERPILRAFFEGRNHHEAAISIRPTRSP